jgi:hypothetical protein
MRILLVLLGFCSSSTVVIPLLIHERAALRNGTLISAAALAASAEYAPLEPAPLSRSALLIRALRRVLPVAIGEDEVPVAAASAARSLLVLLAEAREAFLRGEASPAAAGAPPPRCAPPTAGTAWLRCALDAGAADLRRLRVGRDAVAVWRNLPAPRALHSALALRAALEVAGAAAAEPGDGDEGSEQRAALDGPPLRGAPPPRATGGEAVGAGEDEAAWARLAATVASALAGAAAAPAPSPPPPPPPTPLPTALVALPPAPLAPLPDGAFPEYPEVPPGADFALGVAGLLEGFPAEELAPGTAAPSREAALAAHAARDGEPRPPLNGSALAAARARREVDAEALRRAGARFAFSLPRAAALAGVPDGAFARQEAVRRSFLHAWRAYAAWAWGADVVKPVSRAPATDLCQMGETLVDAVDTGLLMGLPEVYEAARAWVRDALPAAVGGQADINLFECTIRVVGGLLGVHDLSAEPVFLLRAEAVARAFVEAGAFASPTGIPFSTLYLETREGAPGNGTIGRCTPRAPEPPAAADATAPPGGEPPTAAPSAAPPGAPPPAAGAPALEPARAVPPNAVTGVKTPCGHAYNNNHAAGCSSSSEVGTLQLEMTALSARCAALAAALEGAVAVLGDAFRAEDGAAPVRGVPPEGVGSPAFSRAAALLRSLAPPLELPSPAGGTFPYHALGLRAQRALLGVRPPSGLFPIYVHPLSGAHLKDAPVTLGARGDSLYEYLLKEWVALGDWRAERARARALANLAAHLGAPVEAWRAACGGGGGGEAGPPPLPPPPDDRYFEALEALLKDALRALRAAESDDPRPLLRAYNRAVAGVMDRLLQRSSPGGLTYVAEQLVGAADVGAGKEPQLVHKMDHLVCFLPGVLALGSTLGAGHEALARGREAAIRGEASAAAVAATWGAGAAGGDADAAAAPAPFPWDSEWEEDAEYRNAPSAGLPPPQPLPGAARTRPYVPLALRGAAATTAEGAAALALAARVAAVVERWSSSGGEAVLRADVAAYLASVRRVWRRGGGGEGAGGGGNGGGGDAPPPRCGAAGGLRWPDEAALPGEEDEDAGDGDDGGAPPAAVAAPAPGPPPPASVFSQLRARLGAAAERLLATLVPRGRGGVRAGSGGGGEEDETPPDPVVDPFAHLSEPRAIRAALVETARSLAHTCVAMYDTTPTGLAPEIITFHRGRDFSPNADARHSFLRPETLESLFVLRALGLAGRDAPPPPPPLRGARAPAAPVGGSDWVEEAAWRIFTAIEAHARLRTGGHATVTDVGVGPFAPLGEGGVPSAGRANVRDRLDSFVLAETHKYLYLLLSPPPGAHGEPPSEGALAGDDMWEGVRALRGWVFNTEAHPLRVSPPPSTWPAAKAKREGAVAEVEAAEEA